MAFRASNILPDKGLDRAKSIANTLKGVAQRYATQFSSGGDTDDIFQVTDALRQAKIGLNAVRGISGISAHAIEQENDASYDVVVEFNALVATIDGAVAEIVATFPVDGSGFLLGHTMDADGQRVPRVFSSGALSGLVVELNAVIAAII